MATGALALGKTFNIGVGAVPTDAVAGAVTGKRQRMRDGEVLTIVVTGTGASTDILDVDLQEHTASSGGTSRDLDIITKYWYKSEATLDNDETWTEGSQAAASEITDVGAASEETQLVIEVHASQLSDDCDYVSLNIPDLGTNGSKHCSILYILSELGVQRKPSNLPAMLS